MESQTVKLLKNARKLLEPEGSFTKHVFARKANQRETNTTSSEACSFCARGALYLAAGFDSDRGNSYIPLVARRAEGILKDIFNTEEIEVENDKRSTKHLHVLMAYDFAILAAKEEAK